MRGAGCVALAVIGFWLVVAGIILHFIFKFW